jgi:dephospho-CoA kinase
MINYTPTPDFYRDYIQHFNPNHDPINGQFTSAPTSINKNDIISKSKDYKPSKNRPYTKYNVNSWGRSKDKNILWVTGIAGSGKSTIARKYAKDGNANYINIDLYTFKTADKYLNDMSSSFNKYLDENVPNWKKMQKRAYEVLIKNDRRAQKDAGKWFDTLEEALLSYGEQMYGEKKVVAEGVQILDETLFYKNKKALKGKPLIIMDTSVEDSVLSRMSRDNKDINKLLEPERVKQLEGWIRDAEALKKVLK